MASAAGTPPTEQFVSFSWEESSYVSATFHRRLGIVVSLLTAGGLLAAKLPANQTDDPFAAERPPARQPSPSALHKAPARKAGPPAAVKSLGKKSRRHIAKCRHLRSGEAAIAEALGKPIDLQFGETPLTDVIDNLKNYCGIEIQLDIIRLATWASAPTRR